MPSPPPLTSPCWGRPVWAARGCAGDTPRPCSSPRTWTRPPAAPPAPRAPPCSAAPPPATCHVSRVLRARVTTHLLAVDPGQQHRAVHTRVLRHREHDIHLARVTTYWHVSQHIATCYETLPRVTHLLDHGHEGWLLVAHAPHRAAAVGRRGVGGAVGGAGRGTHLDTHVICHG